MALAAIPFGRQGFPLAPRPQHVNNTFKNQPRVFGLAPSACLACVGLVGQPLTNRNQRLYPLQNSSVTSHDFAFPITPHACLIDGKSLSSIYG